MYKSQKYYPHAPEEIYKLEVASQVDIALFISEHTAYVWP